MTVQTRSSTTPAARVPRTMWFVVISWAEGKFESYREDSVSLSAADFPADGSD
ncbi:MULTISPECIES: hypothetical protein [unclassified Haladaptatus]|uniref:hypothetical protein n=1 Tax=unclassified Haladaptatus TaxID=2622732 RepID=UPI00209C4E87|nr:MULTISPECIES: hypothetical protein [unclassified Haladaptatus]MCO8243318.1 hypothetical protein [Haladaptatus sp. AB643]MCO8253029.1 hypothetical protein [Haladaptatus sp. AB618]